MRWLILLAFLHPAAAAPVPRQELAASIRTSMKAWNVAGASVAIVKDGEVVFLQGFGVRDVRTNEPVDPHTIFAIGSMTKSITGILAGLAVDRGKLSLDDLLVRRVPNFSVADPYVTGAATVRDALSHRTGFDWSSDALLLSAASRQELVERLAKLAPAKPFRQNYNYANVIYIVGSEAVARAWGESWESVVERALFAPLGMTRSTARHADLQKLGNVASPHRNMGEGPRPIAPRNIDLAGGAGSIHSSASDMAKVVMMMAEGGKAFLQPRTFEEILTPHINIGVDRELRRFTNFHAYGIGWELIDYKGRKVAYHGGAIDGMLSQMAVVPGERLGIVVLTNTDGARHLPDAITFTLLDRFLGGEQTDWNAPFLQRGTAMRQVLYGTPARVPNTSPTVPLAAFEGVYEAPIGSIEIRRAEDGLAFTFGALQGRLQHWHHDTFRGHFGTYGDRLVTFSLNSERVPSRLDVEFIGDFTR